MLWLFRELFSGCDLVFRIILGGALTLILASCTSPNVSKKLLGRIDDCLKKTYNIEHGSLVATYDLARIHKAPTIYAKDFGRIINEEKYNDNYLKNFKSKYKNLETLEKEAARKNDRLRQLLLMVNSKYRFLSSLEEKQLKSHLASEIFDCLPTKGSNKANTRDLARLDRIASHIPIMLPEYHTRVSSKYGLRHHPIKKKKKFHCGVDLIGSKSTPIYSAAYGRVTKVSRTGSYGNIVEISHERSFKTRYAHLSRIYVKEGETVLRGQKLGLQGKTGHSTGEHLHFEIWLREKHLDPYDFISHGV